MYFLYSTLLSILFLINQITKIKTFYEENCKIKSSTFPNECIECKENYNLINGDCPCYDRNCDSCSSSYPGGCNSCKSPFTFNPKTNSCICNIDNCLFCSEQGCDKCEFGFYLNNNICIKNYTKCDDKNCRICSNSLKGSCKVCYDGYNLEYGKCKLNPTISNPNNEQIEQNNCYRNFFQVKNVCNKNCLEAECENNYCLNKCFTCENNILSEKLNCISSYYCFDKNCISCRNKKEGYCDRCEIGYRLENGKCSKCEDKNCLNCDYTNEGQCNSCMNGYFLINNKCISINETRECYNNNNCKKCQKGNNNYCFECLPGYFLQNGKCTINYIDNCIQYSDNKCVKCSNGYVNNKKGTKCIKNKGNIPHCLNYNNSNKECIECERHYELKDKHNSFIKEKECVLINDFLYLCTSYECMSYYDKYSIIKMNETNEDIDHLEDEENEDDKHCGCGKIIIDWITILMSILFFLLTIFCCYCCCRCCRCKKKNKSIIKKKLDLKVIKKINEDDKKLEKCNSCKNELAIYKLNCGCKLCEVDQKIYFLKN